MKINESSYILRLPYISQNYQDEIEAARTAKLDVESFLTQLLNKEVELRRENGTKSRIRRAKFPYKQYLEDFKYDKYNDELKHKLEELSELKFIDNRENVVLIGTPGSGKTHFAIATGIKACLSGKSVLFTSVPNLVIELHEAINNSVYNSYKRKFEKYDLVILDELGYVSFSKEESEILFNLVSGRYAKGSVMITTNLSFDRWNEVFGDNMVTSAMVDRLAYKAHTLDMTLDTSYRYEATVAWSSKKDQK